MKRIEAIAKMIYPYTKIADIGCDHGYLIIEAFENHQIKKALGIDNKMGPLKSCYQNIKDKSYQNDIKLICSDGIKEIEEDTEVVIIAGMGGMNVVNILNDDLKNVSRLIIQANKDNFYVRKKLIELGFKITNEEVVFDSDIYYEIICADATLEQVSYSDFECQFGPVLLLNKKRLFLDMLKNNLSRLEIIPKKTAEIELKIKNIKMIIGE